VSSGIFEWSGVSQPPTTLLHHVDGLGEKAKVPTLIGWTSNAPGPTHLRQGTPCHTGPTRTRPAGTGAPSAGCLRLQDVLAPEEGLVRPPWSHVWAGIPNCGLSHRERECAFRVLHGCVFTGVFKGYLHMTVPADALFCLHTTCGAPHFDTLSHTFLTCPRAQQL
jgi:hypothetical protein